jgi:hypothetical protein
MSGGSSLLGAPDFASYAEYDLSSKHATRQTILQESFERAALQTELEERPICRGTKIVKEARTSNIAILSRHQVQVMTILHQLPAAKIQEYDTFPLAHRAGLIHSIPEEKLSLASATIIDVNFLGLFPKSLLSVLRSYKNTLPKDIQTDFESLIAKLVNAFIYRPITIQRIIHYVIAAIKSQIETDCKQRESTMIDSTSVADTPSENIATSRQSKQSKANMSDTAIQKICHANR